MAQLLELTIDTLRNLPPPAQDEIARSVLRLAGDDEAAAIPMSAEEEASFDESMAQAERGEFVSDDVVAASSTKRGS